MPFPIAIPAPSDNTVKTLVLLGVGIFAYKKVKDYLEDLRKKKGEESINTPEGQIALQLKNLFAFPPVNEAKYKEIMTQVTPANDKAVRDSYYEQTGRYLSDDEARHISTQSQQTQAKQYKINSTPGTLIKIEGDQIKFNVGPGSYVRFRPGQKTPVGLYYKAEDIGEGKPAPVSLPPNSKLWKVANVKLVDVNGVTLRKDWKLVFAAVLPLMLLAKTHKQYAAVQIDVSGKGQTFMWINATDMITANSLSGVSPIEKEVVTISPAEIFNERFEALKAIPKGIYLGTPLMTLNTGKGIFTQVRTVQGLIRWVRSETVRVIKK